MMKKTKIETIWDDLENDRDTFSGTLTRRYSASVRPDIFVGLRMPERRRCLLIPLHSGVLVNVGAPETFREIKLELLPEVSRPGINNLILVLTDPALSDIFAVLCEDLIDSVKDEDNSERLLEEIVARLEKWKQLFQLAGQPGLSAQSQRGLYGELYFLRIWLSYSSSPELCVRSWKGGEAASQDFQGEGFAIEVKTTQSKNHQRIVVNSERQLDERFCGNLFLFHLSLDVRDGGGESLNSIVAELDKGLESTPVASVIFRRALYTYGYFVHHINLYDTPRYQVREQSIFQIKDNFPRITEAMLPQGVGEVNYSVNLSNCLPFKIEETYLFTKI